MLACREHEEARHSPLTTHCSLPITHHPPPTTQRPSLTTRRSPLVTHRPPPIAHCSPLIVHRPLLAAYSHRLPLIARCLLRTAHRSPLATHRTSLVVRCSLLYARHVCSPAHLLLCSSAHLQEEDDETSRTSVVVVRPCLCHDCTAMCNRSHQASAISNRSQHASDTPVLPDVLTYLSATLAPRVAPSLIRCVDLCSLRTTTRSNTNSRGSALLATRTRDPRM